MEKAEKIERLKTAFFQFLNSGAEDDLSTAEGVYYFGDVSMAQYAAVVLMRKFFSLLLLSASREGLIPAIDESSIPWLYDEDCKDEYKEEIFPRRNELDSWAIFNDRVIESFVMPVLDRCGWKEVMLLQEGDEADELEVPLEIKEWVREEIKTLYNENAYQESDADDDMPHYFIPECSGFAVVVYHNPLYSRLMYLCGSLEEKGYRLDDILQPEELSIIQMVAGYNFLPTTRMCFSIHRIWLGEQCYHCCLTSDTVEINDWGYENVEVSYYKYAHPSLIFELPELDAGMKKLLPVVEALIEKAEAGELHAMRSVA